jgi:hypothetical protein
MESLEKISSSLRLPPRVREGLRLYRILKGNWSKIMEEVASETEPLYFEQGVLVIGVGNHYILQKLSSQYLVILERIRALFPEKDDFPVRTLKFVYHPPRQPPKRGSPLFQQVFLTEDNLAELKHRCQDLSDPELREAFLRLLQRLAIEKNLP